MGGTVRGIKRKDAIAVGVALVAGIAAYFELRSWRTREPAIESPRFLRAEMVLPAGHPVGLKDFSAPPADESVRPRGAYTDQDWPLVEGRRLVKELGAGDYLLEEHLAPRKSSWGRRIPRGLRAYSVRAVGADRVQAGDWVDLMTESGDTAAQGVRVFSRARGESEEAVLLLTPRQIQLLEKKRQNGKLTLALRNPDDFPEPLSGERAPRRGRKRNQKIEVWSEAE